MLLLLLLHRVVKADLRDERVAFLRVLKVVLGGAHATRLVIGGKALISQHIVHFVVGAVPELRLQLFALALHSRI